MKVIIGGSGFIGSKLCDYYSKKGELLVGTYYNNKKEGLIYFDLENPDLNNLGVDLKKAKTLFLCSSICKIDECKKYEKKAYKVNVLGTIKLLKQCFEKGILPVFFSSDYVFGRKEGNHKETDTTCPTTVYGFHKKLIEDHLLNQSKPFLIARVSLIYGTEPCKETYFVDMINKLKRNETLMQATDQSLTPTHVNDLINLLDYFVKNNLTGLYNMVAPEVFSRYELAKMVKDKLNIKLGKIIPCSINDFDFLEKNRPINISLNNEKITKITNYNFITISQAISSLKPMVECV